jgi:hypothetical protein
MKQLAALPLIALLALTGCSCKYEEEPKAPESMEAMEIQPEGETGNYLLRGGLQIETSTELTTEEQSALDLRTQVLPIGDEELTYTVKVTDSDGQSKNIDFVQEKHVRITIDTGSLGNCKTMESSATPPDSAEHTRPGDKGIPDCISAVVLTAAPAADTKEGHGDETGFTADMKPGRNTIDFDAINSNYVGLAIKLGSGKETSINALTGEIRRIEKIGDTERELHPELVPGLTAEQTAELSAIKPQYANGNYSLAVGKPVITKSTEGFSVISVPVKMRLTAKPCSASSLGCHSIDISTSSKETEIASEAFNYGEGIPIHEEFAGTLIVDSPDFDEATLILTTYTEDKVLVNDINLLTGE